MSPQRPLQVSQRPGDRRVLRAAIPVVVTGVGIAAATLTRVRHGFTQHAAGITRAVGPVAARAVVRPVGEAQHVGVGVGIVVRAVVRDAERAGPDVLALIEDVPAALLQVTLVAIDIEDGPGVSRVFLRPLEDVSVSVALLV